jgi:hypothetical protein
LQLKLIKFSHELLAGSLKTGLVNHSEDLVRLDPLIGLHEHLLNPASQLALDHNVLTGRADNASGAHGFLNRPKTRGHNK